MHYSNRLLLVLLTALFVLAGCGDDPAQSAPYEDISDEELGIAISADAFCEAIWECHDEAGTVAELSVGEIGRFDSLSDCKNNLSDAMATESSDNEFTRAIEEGRAVVDRSHAADCRDDIKDRLCEGNNLGAAEEPESCQQLLEGQQQEGEPCLDSVACSGTQLCDTFSTEETCYGECQPRSETNCGDENCASDEYCDGFDDDATCQPRGDVGDHCEEANECQSHLWCDHREESCVPLEVVSEGEECDFGTEICEPTTRCFIEEEPESLDDLEGTCTPIGQPGDECVATMGCRYDLFCHHEDEGAFHGECTGSGTIGDPCEDDAHCDDGYCDWETDVCTEYLESGESCGFDVDGRCPPAEYCAPEGDEQVCKAAETDQCELPDGDENE